jgi:hypothetical protein
MTVSQPPNNQQHLRILWDRLSRADDLRRHAESIREFSDRFLAPCGIVCSLTRLESSFSVLDLDTSLGPRLGHSTEARLLYVTVPDLRPSAVHATLEAARREALQTKSFAICVGLSPYANLEKYFASSYVPVAVLSLPDLIEVATDAHPSQTLVGRLRHRIGLTPFCPYVIRGPVRPDMFFGRKQELAHILHSGHSAAFIGSRQVGKTSLLLAAASELKRQHRPKAFIDCSNACDPQEFLASLIRELLPRGYHRWERIGAGWRIEDLLRQVAETESPPLLLLDEADALLASSSTHITSALRSAANAGYCQVCLAGYKLLNNCYHNGLRDPVPSFCEPTMLVGLHLPEAVRLLTEPMADLGVSWDDETLPETIAVWFGMHPCHLQRYSAALLEQLDHTRSHVITKSLATHVSKSPALIEYAKAMLEQNTTILERFIAFATAEATHLSAGAVVNLVRPFVHTFRESQAAKECIDLCLAGVLRESGSGYISASPFLRYVISHQYDVHRQIRALGQQITV